MVLVSRVYLFTAGSQHLSIRSPHQLFLIVLQKMALFTSSILIISAVFPLYFPHMTAPIKHNVIFLFSFDNEVDFIFTPTIGLNSLYCILVTKVVFYPVWLLNTVKTLQKTEI